MKIAFATDNGKEINAHFGLAKMFAVYEMSAKGYSLADNLALRNQGDDRDDNIQERLDALAGCAIVYCTRIGGTAAARLVKNKIHPIKVNVDLPIDMELERLHERLNTNPPAWLRKAMAQRRWSANG